MAGIREVAQQAGVSIATVSRAMRGLPNVRPETRELVQKVARELGYWPSPAASSLATGRTRSIGLLTPWVNRWFNCHVIDGAERELRAHNFDVLLHTFNLDADDRRNPLDPQVFARRVDGILVVGTVLEPRELAQLEALEVPLVFIGPGPPGHYRVFVDDEAAISAAVTHLLDLGHRTIAHISGMSQERPEWSPPVRRREAFLKMAASHGLELAPSLYATGNFSTASGKAAMAKILAERPDATAFVIDSDEMAFGALSATAEAGVKVPEDVSVISIDGIEVGALLGLTTLAQDAFSQGVAGARAVLELLAGNEIERDTVFTPHLVRRSSTGPVTSRQSLPPA